jgi:hypothetical protein
MELLESTGGSSTEPGVGQGITAAAACTYGLFLYLAISIPAAQAVRIGQMFSCDRIEARSTPISIPSYFFISPNFG